MSPAPDDRLWGHWRTIALLCLGAAAARITTSYALPNVAHPDETFQYLEQAYRLVTGKGLIPWEYQVGARSWLLPWIITPAVALGHLLSPDPVVLRTVVAAFLAILSSGAVIAAYRIGLVKGGRIHALFAGLLTACWAEIVQLSPHMLADTISAITLIAALAFGARLGRSTRREILFAGIMLGLTIIVRPQLGPACVVAGLAVAGLLPDRRWVPMAVGLLLPIALLGVTDWLTWGEPFHSVLLYVRINGGGMANLYGTAPPGWYVANEAMIWGVALPAIILSAVFGARRAPLPLAAALIIIATFSAVAHKEWRFIFPALPLLFTVCGIGTVELARIAADRFGGPFTRRRLYVASALLWITLSLLSGVRGMMRPLWLQDAGAIHALDRASADPGACAIGIDRPEQWAHSGMVRIRPDMRLYAAVAAAAPDFNYILSFTAAQTSDRFASWGFAQISCADDGACLYRRPGGCTDGNAHQLQAPPAEDARRLLEDFRRR
ncbi:hypothetical protein ASE00_03280 [Sphingomonas sp. Root710]|uniref:hypothetical protein n=1 Tax=Sphingomonas sp. Root710 TaxID=1736594 RepID=UPI0006F33839|nr:hypothetical protein [Sphingomonas sp. Root710]KRB85804.1 hypothetical protein ASE00_03280 [Sphingomonas sp. Root710]